MPRGDEIQVRFSQDFAPWWASFPGCLIMQQTC